jgi:hypothetical protein
MKSGLNISVTERTRKFSTGDSTRRVYGKIGLELFWQEGKWMENPPKNPGPGFHALPWSLLPEGK